MAAPAFTEHDVSKAIAGAARQGLSPSRVDVDRRTGTISLFFTPTVQVEVPAQPEDEIAAWLEDHDNSNSARRA